MLTNRVTPVEQLRPHVRVVEHMAVADHHQRAIFVEENARTCLPWCGAQMAKSKRDPIVGVDEPGVVVRAATLQGGRHRWQFGIEMSLPAQRSRQSKDGRHDLKSRA